MQPNVELLAKRVAQLERSNRLMKVAGGIAIAVLLCAAATPHPAVNTTHLNLVNGSGQVLASLGANQNGGASLTFFDNSGHQMALVGESSDGRGEGLQVFDGNSLMAGNGLARATFGGGLGNGVFSAGFGEAVVDGSGAARYGDGLGTQNNVSSVIVFDSNGKLRAGIDADPTNNFAGLFTQNGSGVNMSFLGNALDNSGAFLGLDNAAGTLQALSFVRGDGGFSGYLLSDTNGGLRSGLDFDTDTGFTGMFTQTGTGGGMTIFGNTLDNSASFSDLLDSNGIFRVVDFQNGASEAVQVFDSSGKEQGHLP